MTIADIEKARDKIDDTMFSGDYADNQAARETIRASLDLHAKWLKLRETHRLVPVDPTGEMLLPRMAIKFSGNELSNDGLIEMTYRNSYPEAVVELVPHQMTTLYKAMLNASKAPEGFE